MSTDVLSVRLPVEVKQRLDALSRVTGRPTAYYVREALTEHLDELEWAYGLAAYAEDVRRGAEPTRSLEDFAVELGHTLSGE